MIRILKETLEVRKITWVLSDANLEMATIQQIVQLNQTNDVIKDHYDDQKMPFTTLMMLCSRTPFPKRSITVPCCNAKLPPRPYHLDLIPKMKELLCGICFRTVNY